MMEEAQDHIGDRLDHPERVPEALRHLIPDDQARAKWILSQPVQGHVLDIGCSDHAISRRIQQTWNVQLLALDIEQWDIRTPYSWGCDRNPFDTIVCTEVLEHLFPYESVAALAHLWDILKPGGTMILTVPNRAPRGLALNRQRWAWSDHRQYFTWARFDELLKAQFAYVETRVIVDQIWLGAVCQK